MKRTPLNSPHARLRVAGSNLAAQSQSWRDLDLRAKALISLVVAVGTGVLLYAAVYPTSKNIAQFICYLLIAILAARLKVHLPGITGTMSVNFLFILLGVLELSLPETLILGSAAVVVQCFYRDRHSPIQVTFNLCASAFATAVAYDVYHLAIGEGWFRSHPLLLGLAASTYFLANTGSIATVISLTERKALNKIWVDCYFWSFPYYLVGAAFAGMLGWFNRAFGWETSLLIVPVIYLIYRSYRLYLGKLEDEKRHVEEMANLHLRTIEALAPEEFEKMKIHPVVGAEILERVRFPYPVVPIVRAHHEKWDGSGYPFGLKGTDIPIGARILSAVDFLDAMASDRQYRRALPMHEVLQRLAAESGKSFDPKVVEVLEKRHRQLEKLVEPGSDNEGGSQLSTDLKVERGEAPAAGFEDIAIKDPTANKPTDLCTIAAARQEAKTRFVRSQDLGASLSLAETLSV